mmetsp:Transcript_107083/g.313128  ORF Transcript_107083/g.313128 Transcript_107083/m.313128 type:complete len:231 (-) Transcript_107083:3-695(-)
MGLVFEQLLQQRPAPSPRRRPDAEDAVGLLRVEQVVLVLVAAHPAQDWRIVLDCITQSHIVLEPEAADRGALCVALVVRAVALVAAAAAVLVALAPGGCGAPGKVEGGVDVRAAVPAAGTGEGHDPTASVQDDGHPLRRRADEQVYEVVRVGVDVPVDPRRLDPVQRVVEPVSQCWQQTQQQACRPHPGSRRPKGPARAREECSRARLRGLGCPLAAGAWAQRPSDGGGS